MADCCCLLMNIAAIMALLVQKLSVGSAPFPLINASCDVVGQRVYLFSGNNGKAPVSDLLILETGMLLIPPIHLHSMAIYASISLCFFF